MHRRPLIPYNVCDGTPKNTSAHRAKGGRRKRIKQYIYMCVYDIITYTRIDEREAADKSHITNFNWTVTQI